MKKFFKVTYTLLLEPIPNKVNPEYNDGYNTKQVESFLTAYNEDEILEKLSGSEERIEKFTCTEVEEIDTLKNPADIVEGKIAESHRQIAKEFAEKLTKEQAVTIWKYFKADITEMGKYFNQKFSSFYMLCTLAHSRNVFISEWLCREVIDKAS